MGWAKGGGGGFPGSGKRAQEQRLRVKEYSQVRYWDGEESLSHQVTGGGGKIELVICLAQKRHGGTEIFIYHQSPLQGLLTGMLIFWNLLEAVLNSRRMGFRNQEKVRLVGVLAISDWGSTHNQQYLEDTGRRVCSSQCQTLCQEHHTSVCRYPPTQPKEVTVTFVSADR